MKQCLINSAKTGGQEVPTKFRPAKDLDRYVVGSSVLVTGDSILENDVVVHQGLTFRMRWQISGKALWIELTRANLEYVLLSIKHSKIVEKKSKTKKLDSEGLEGALKNPLEGSPKRRGRRRAKRHKSDSHHEEKLAEQAPVEEQPTLD